MGCAMREVMKRLDTQPQQSPHTPDSDPQATAHQPDITHPAPTETTDLHAMPPQVGLVLASRSQELADELMALASQMAKDVVIIPTSSLDPIVDNEGKQADGDISLACDAIDTAVHRVMDKGLACAIFTDMKSVTTTMTAATDTHDTESVRLVNAPFVEAAVAGAVAAQRGEDLDGVEQAARCTISSFTTPPANSDENSQGDNRNTPPPDSTVVDSAPLT